jgi:hypothetical protein
MGDFCLALALDRCYGGAVWYPQAFSDGNDDLAEVAQHTLAGVIDDVVDPHGARSVLFTSLTMDGAQLEATVQTLREKTLSDFRFSVQDPAGLPLGRPQRLLDQEQADRVHRVPFVGADLAGELPRLQPTKAGAKDVWACTWQVDITVDQHQLPARWCVNEHLSTEGEYARAELRSGVDGISYFSHSMGFVAAGSRVDQALARPQLRLPGARETFDALLAAAELHSRESAAGRFTQAALDLWGGLDQLASDLRRPSTNTLLHAYLCRPKRPSQEEEAPGVFLQGQDRRFLSFADAVTATQAPETEVRTVLDDYIAKRILRRGLILQCGRCSHAAWYRLEELGQSFVCARCQQASLIIQAAWKKPETEPYWYYDLDEAVYQALGHNMRAPVLALAELASGAASVLTRTEADVYRGDLRIAEVDLWAVVDGKIIIGEAKTADRLSQSAKEERKVAHRLAEVAVAVSADEVVLATTAPAWNPQTIAAMEQALPSYAARLRCLAKLGAE